MIIIMIIIIIIIIIILLSKAYNNTNNNFFKLIIIIYFTLSVKIHTLRSEIKNSKTISVLSVMVCTQLVYLV